MNNSGIDIISVIFLGIAVVIFLYLRSILGSRTGNERNTYDTYRNDGNEQSPSTRDRREQDNVITMPERTDHHDAGDETQAMPPVNMDEQIEKYAEADSPLAKGLRAIADADDEFVPTDFMDGAERAYEMIISAFSEGDKRMLKRLLAKDVFIGFTEAIDAREANNQTMTTQFVGFDNISMLEAGIEDKQAEITVKFKSSLIRIIKDQAGTVIEGNEKEIEKVTDIWTFARPLSGRDPNWKLIGTKSES